MINAVQHLDKEFSTIRTSRANPAMLDNILADAYGNKTPLTQFWSNQLSSFLDEIVEIKKNGKVILIGNSLGALTAITTLSQSPEIIETVIAAPLPEPVFLTPRAPIFP